MTKTEARGAAKHIACLHIEVTFGALVTFLALHVFLAEALPGLHIAGIRVADCACSLEIGRAHV